METVKLRSYAKINLTLDVSRLRPDGYHDIDSVVQVIDLSDELEVWHADQGDIEVSVECGDAPADRTNLVCRAAEAFFGETGVRGGARFVLAKTNSRAGRAWRRQRERGGGHCRAESALRLWPCAR